MKILLGTFRVHFERLDRYLGSKASPRAFRRFLLYVKKFEQLKGLFFSTFGTRKAYFPGSKSIWKRPMCIQNLSRLYQEDKKILLGIFNIHLERLDRYLGRKGSSRVFRIFWLHLKKFEKLGFCQNFCHSKSQFAWLQIDLKTSRMHPKPFLALQGRWEDNSRYLQHTFWTLRSLSREQRLTTCFQRFWLVVKYKLQGVRGYLDLKYAWR